MKKIVKIFFLFTLFSSLLSCDVYVVVVEPPTGTVQSPYYVQVYIIPDNFSLYEDKFHSNCVLDITFTGEELWHAYDLTSDEFYEIAHSFGDGSYTGYILPGSNQAITEAIASIDVVCDKDFNEQHPAGSSLGDIIMFCATSPYEFIQGGYKDEDMVKNSDYPDYWKYMLMNQGIGYKPIELLVNSVNEENSIMLYPYCYLYFEEEPAQSGEYIFTVTIRTSEGKEFTQTISYTYEETTG